MGRQQGLVLGAVGSQLPCNDCGRQTQHYYSPYSSGSLTATNIPLSSNLPNDLGRYYCTRFVDGETGPQKAGVT